MALCATSSYYDITEIATRILPNVVVLTIDPDRLSILQMIGLYSFFPPSSTCSRMCFFCDMFLFLQLIFFVLFLIRGRKREGGRCSRLLLMVILSNFIASVVFEVGVGSEPELRS
jgi:hypothetical protein